MFYEKGVSYMRTSVNRVGEVSYKSNGDRMTIIAYRSYKDIDVQFDDGEIRRGVTYDHFKKGFISRSTKRLGEVRYNTSGYKMTIVAYRSVTDIDVQFDDGTILRGITYQHFLSGRVLKTPQSVERIGEVGYNNKHERMVIVAYKSATDIDVQFEDGTIRTGVAYSSFKSGNISKEGCSGKVKYTDKRVGEVRRNNDGLLMRIKAYRSSRDVDVEFENGNIRYSVTYHSFKSGTLKDINKLDSFKSRVGKIGYNTEGLKMIIKDYRSASDIDVEFEDGEVIRGVRYQSFLKGYVPKSKSKVGECSVNRKGQRMWIKAYRGNKNIDVEFEDGTIRTGVTYQNFKNGSIIKSKNRVGEVSYSTKGEKMTIVRDAGSMDIDVEFEDGTIRTGVTYQNFQYGRVSKIPRRSMKVIDSGRVGEVNYNSKGERMEIVAYRGVHDIDVKFDNGRVKKGVFYHAFKQGNVLCDRVGEVNYNSKGERMEITAYRGNCDIDVIFEDGTERKGVRYSSFKNGSLNRTTRAKSISRFTRMRNEVLGKENKNIEGFYMRVIEYRSSIDIDVQFSDGTIRRHCTYSNFKKGKILRVPRQRRG